MPNLVKIKHRQTWFQSIQIDLTSLLFTAICLFIYNILLSFIQLCVSFTLAARRGCISETDTHRLPQWLISSTIRFLHQPWTANVLGRRLPLIAPGSWPSLPKGLAPRLLYHWKQPCSIWVKTGTKQSLHKQIIKVAGTTNKKPIREGCSSPIKYRPEQQKTLVYLCRK